ncbi:MAG TPA: TIGR03857 family LLM class F420-dependent oxidoreductase [Trebonia sp.]|jgi:probable F420-dependent oxidoreductase|nr:TIGR03857 family LLM class F420-dependent oxidoreductase [Trebonia sp.]
MSSGKTTVPLARLGAYVLPGAAHDPASGIEQARATERMGLGTTWIGERYDTKDLGALGGALSQATRRVQIAAGITHPYLRHPMVLASMGQTLQALTGGRFHLGLGRSASWRWAAYGQPAPTLAALADIAGILRRLWDGQTVEYEGPLGRFPQLRLPVVLDAPPPPLLLAAIGPKTLALAGRCYDGVILHPLLTPAAVRRSRDIVRAAASEAGRDPDRVRCYATVLCAPAVSESERQLAIEARAAGYLSLPGLGDSLARINAWDAADLARYRGQRVLTDLGAKPADKYLSRAELIKLCEGMPPSWLASCTAAGTVGQTAAVLADYLAAGADELILHGVVGEGLAPLADYLAAESG